MKIPDTDDRNPVEVLAEEFAERHRNGERPSIPEYQRRYPEHAQEIEDLFPMLLLMEGVRADSSGATAVEAPPGLERLGDYEIVRELGRGGMGVVYEATHGTLNRRVALKVLPEVAGVISARKLERFQREAQAAARLHHTNIVPVFEVGCDQGLHYYAMQFIEGESLDRVIVRLRQDGHGSILCDDEVSLQSDRFYRRVAEIGLQLSSALAYAHSLGTLHRDIKPGNALVDQEGNAWIADFGLAKNVLSSGSETEALTLSGAIVGTLRYIAPEQRRGEPEPRSDVFALGVTLQELATLARPGEALRASGLPRDLETVLLKATEEEAELRYASAEDLAEDLRRFLADQPVLARRASSWERCRRWCRRNPALAGTSLVALLALIAVGVVGWVGYVQKRDALVLEQKASKEAKEARALARSNVELSIAALQDIFDALEAQQVTELPRTRRSGPRRGGGDAAAGNSESGVSYRQEKRVLETVLSFFHELAARNKTDFALQWEAARAYLRIAAIQERLEDREQAVESRRAALGLLDQLVEQDPQHLVYVAVRLGVQLDLLPQSLADCRDAAVTKQFEQIVQQATRLPHSNHVQLRQLQAKVLAVGARLAEASGDFSGAEDQLSQAVEHWHQDLVAERSQLNARAGLGIAIQSLVDFYLRRERGEDALVVLKRELDLLVPAHERRPPPNLVMVVALIEDERSRALDRLGRRDEAREARRRANFLRNQARDHRGPPPRMGPRRGRH